MTSSTHIAPLICVIVTSLLTQHVLISSDAASVPLSRRQRRMIGGSEFAEGKWPWLVSLQGKVPDVMVLGIPLSYQRYYCGASLLNNRWVLTAAHCFTETKQGDRALYPRYWHAKLGEVELKSSVLERVRGFFGNLLDVDGMKHWYIHGEKIYIHPQYNSSDLWKNDIALIKLEKEVPSGVDIFPNIQKISLNSVDNLDFPATGQNCYMKGWGCTANGGSVATVAQEVMLPKVSDVECSHYWGIPATLRMCAGYSSVNSRGICSGDSGGPLVCHNGHEWVQVGIASFTSASRPGNVPGVFTRVSKYVTWIHEVITADWKEPIQLPSVATFQDDQH